MEVGQDGNQTRHAHAHGASAGVLIGVCFLIARATAQAPVDNGIHVGAPKVYDSRALTLMLDDLARSLRKTSFVDPKALASALGNLQGYRSDDLSQGFSANGAVGPQAASVFSGSSGTASGATTSPGVSINVAPTLNAGTAPATSASGGPSAGPAAPSLPSLQTAPSFTPGFGSNGADLLADEVNLTYQFDNIRMLLDRSLTDRLFNHEARLQAVVGFDVDIEPSDAAKDSAAVVEVTVTVDDCGGLSTCNAQGNLSLVAMMPEEGSHNAATLSQKANAFGGAVAASVFSVGYSVQKRSQIFYLYRDMDTVSFEKPAGSANSAVFGWQFRPVLGRRSVSPGMRHMLAVLALPAGDAPNEKAEPHLNVKVRTSWTRYDGKTQTAPAALGFWEGLFAHPTPPESGLMFPPVAIPSTFGSQSDLAPAITGVRWVRTEPASGVAIVTGRNFFPETTVRFGPRLYSTPTDGLLIKSDQELEVAVPLSAAVAGGVLSGRYGIARPLESLDENLPERLSITRLEFSPEGNDMYEVDATLQFESKHHDVKVSLADVEARANAPVVSANGVPLTTPSYLTQPASKDANPPLKLITFLPASLVKAGPVTITVTFPFGGPGWTASMAHYDASLRITRLGGKTNTRLLISATDPTMLLCGKSWVLQLDKGRELALSDANSDLKCEDAGSEMLSLDVSTSELKDYHRFVLVDRSGDFPPLVGEIPAADPPPPGPSLDKDQNVSVTQYDVKTVTYKGKNLDQVKKVLFDKAELLATPAQDGKSIVIALAAVVTAKPREVELELISDDHDPLEAPLKVVPSPSQKGK